MPEKLIYGLEVDYYAVGVIIYLLIEDRFPCQANGENLDFNPENKCYQRYMKYEVLPLVQMANEPMAQTIYQICQGLM